METKIKCSNNCGDMKLVETVHICEKCFNRSHTFNWSGCVKCHKLTIERNVNFAVFCEDHAPTHTFMNKENNNLNEKDTRLENICKCDDQIVHHKLTHKLKKPEECTFGCEHPFYGINNTCPVHNKPSETECKHEWWYEVSGNKAYCTNCLKVKTNPPETDLEWEKEFDKKFMKKIHGYDCDGCCIHEFNKRLKDFIKSLLSQKDQKLREMVQSMTKPLRDYADCPRYNSGYNQAISDILKKIKQI